MERGDSGRAGLAPELGEGVFQMLANGVLAEAARSPLSTIPANVLSKQEIGICFKPSWTKKRRMPLRRRKTTSKLLCRNS
jgi:hypothetical protein